MLGTAPVGSALHHLYGYWRVAADAARFTSLDSHNLAANYGNYAVYLPKSLGNDAADLGKVMVPKGGNLVEAVQVAALLLTEQPAVGSASGSGKRENVERQGIYIIPFP